MPNKRVFYACQAVAIAECGTSSFTRVIGGQSVGINTRFNLEQVFELGQISIYENIENIPDIDITIEKVLDGNPLVYHLGTKGANSASLVGRSNERASIGLSVYSDVQDSASGTPLSQCLMSGVYVNSLNYTFPVNGVCTESVSFVGNNKVWSSTSTLLTSPSFSNNDTPPASGGVQRREDVIFGSGHSILPGDIPGITVFSGSGYNILSGGNYGASIQQIRVSTSLGRDQLFELGRRGPFHRYAQFPIEVRSDFEVLTTLGDGISALEDSESNLTSRKIVIKMRDGTWFDLGTQNKLASDNQTGGNAGQNGGNVSVTYSYTNFNDLTITAPHDPAML